MLCKKDEDILVSSLEMFTFLYLRITLEFRIAVLCLSDEEVIG